MPCRSDCPRCGRSCPVRAHRSAYCKACFTSFSADRPEACLTAAERAARQLVVTVDQDGETVLEPDASRVIDQPAHGPAERLFDAPRTLRGQMTLDDSSSGPDTLL